MKKLVAVFTVFALVLSLGGIALAADYPSKPFECIAPSGAGGGWDTTIRMTTNTLTKEGIINQPMPVVNKVGGGGGVALAYLQKRKGNPYTLAVYSPPLLLINLTGQTKLSYKDTTPIAMLINDYGAFAVPADSPYKTINDVIEAIKKDPKSVKMGGGSSPGSMDHIQFLQVAKAAGIKGLKDIPYIAIQEGSMATLMGGHIDLLSTGMAEVVGPMEAGDIRVLAITAPKRVAEGPLAEIPTVMEEGIDTTFINWRGIFGPPEMPDYALEYMENALAEMVKTDIWDEVCTRNGWTKAFMGSDDFSAFLDKTDKEYKEILQEIGFYKGN